MKQQGVCFHPIFPKKRKVVTVDFNLHSVLVRNDFFEQTWEVKNLILEIGGANNHLYFFKDILQPKVCFYLPKNKELTDFLHSLHQEDWLRVLKKSESKERKTFTFILLGFLLLAFSIFALYQARFDIRDKVVQSIPYKYEQSLGTKVVDHILPPSKRLNDSSLTSSLNNMLVPLRKAAPQEYQNFKVYISNDPLINAFALPGGVIIFNLGTLIAVNSAEEILGIAAHELIHIEQRHVLKNMLQGVGLFAFVQFFLGDMSGLIAVIINQGSFLLNKKFSREMEREADRLAFQRLIKANIDPSGMISFYKKLQESQNPKFAHLEGKLEFISTHPHIESRIKKIESMLKQLDQQKLKRLKSFEGDLKKMKDILQKRKTL